MMLTGRILVIHAHAHCHDVLKLIRYYVLAETHYHVKYNNILVLGREQLRKAGRQ